MNQFMENDFVKTSEGLLINNKYGMAIGISTQDGAVETDNLLDDMANQSLWKEELIQTNIMSNNHQLLCVSKPSRRVRNAACVEGDIEEASFTQNQGDVLKNKIANEN